VPACSESYSNDFLRQQCDQIGQFFANWATFGELTVIFYKDEVAKRNYDILSYFFA